MTDPKPTPKTSAEVCRDLNAAVDPKYTKHVVTVAQLRAALAGLPDDAIVILAKDAEGNSYSPLASRAGAPAVEEVLYYPESTWAGEVESIDNEADWGSSLWAVLLGPVN